MPTVYLILFSFLINRILNSYFKVILTALSKKQIKNSFIANR
jgi:hypothetical protein